MQQQELEFIIKQFEHYKSLGEKTFHQLQDEDLFWKYNEDSNSIANIVHHLSGNMLSRFTDFLETDGEKPWRNRDIEFEDSLTDKETLIAKWNEGWNCLLSTVRSLEVSDLHKTVYIRNEKHSVIEAISRQLAHYPYHIGQIVAIGKMRSTKNWQSLSIPKGNSQKYNDEKFSS